MRRSYSVASARAKLAEIVDEVASGQDVEIMRRGKKVAVLVSPARYARMSGKGLGFGSAFATFMRKHGTTDFGVEANFAEGLRDRGAARPVKL